MDKIARRIQLRIKVVEPPEDVAFALQEGASGLVAPSEQVAGSPVFEFHLNVADLDSVPVRFTGAFAQGPASARFVYVCAGARAGQAGSCWSRRAKVPLAGIDPALVTKALSEGRALAGEIPGRAKDGGPVCASVALLSGWQLA